LARLGSTRIGSPGFFGVGEAPPDLGVTELQVWPPEGQPQAARSS
jgi:hypothetical protein